MKKKIKDEKRSYLKSLSAILGVSGQVKKRLSQLKLIIDRLRK